MKKENKNKKALREALNEFVKMIVYTSINE